MARKPASPLDESSPYVPSVDTATLLAEYEQTRDGRLNRCRVCDSPYRTAIDEMMRSGGGAPSIARFMQRRLGLTFSNHTLHRHKSLHLDAAPG